MCLAVPGKVVEIKEAQPGVVGQLAMVDFQGNKVEVSLAMVPEAELGSWVLVHAGFAINVLDEQEAAETWQSLKEAGLDLEIPGSSDN